MKADVSKLRTFFAELRRRKVVRTGVAYAVGAAALWQVVDVMAPALGWSDRLLTFVVVGAIALAPLVLALAWVFEIRPEGVGVEDGATEARPSAADSESTGMAPESSAVGGPSGGGNRTLAPALGGLGLSALLAWALWPASLGGVAGFAAGDETLISRCESSSGDPDLAGVLNTALDATLGQSGYATLASRDRARTFAQHYLGRTPPIAVDAALANELGVRWGLKVVIHCAVRQVDNSYQVSATLTAPEGPRDLAVLTETAAEGDLIEAIDVLSVAALEALGESLADEDARKPLAAVTTGSLNALRAYTAGVDAEYRGEWDLATQHFLDAVEQDTLFARAHAALGTRYYWTGNRPEGEASFQRALRNADRISERDRAWIEAGLASSRGNGELAIQLYQQYVDVWPNDPSAWYNLGTQFFRTGNCDEAGSAFGRALSLNPLNASAHINLASCLANVGGLDSALVHYDSAFALRPDWVRTDNLNHEYGFVLVKAGRLTEAEALFEGQRLQEGTLGGSGARSAALLHMYQGRYQSAATLLEEGARRRQAAGQALSELRDRTYLAGVYDVLGRAEEANAQLVRVVALLDGFYASPAWLYNVVRRSLLLGRVATAEAIARRAASDTLPLSPTDRAAGLLISAEINAMNGEVDRALEDARLAEEIDAGSRSSMVRCRLALLAERTEEARDVCSRIIADANVGWELQEPTLLARFWLGRLEEREGDRELARQHYQDFLSQWEGADEGLLFRDLDGSRMDVIAEARERLAGLRDR